MRQGISFTMTLIIVAVVLLVGSVTILSLFGSGMTDFFNVLDTSTTSTAVEQQCQQVKRELQRKVCDAYTNQEHMGMTDDTDHSLRYSQSANTGHLETCNELKCGLGDQNEEKFTYDTYQHNDPNEVQEISYIVTIEGDQYNCYKQGYIPETCPVQ